MSTTETNLPLKPLQESVELDWSDLPADLLQIISEKLHDICDFIYFRSVCKRWYASTSISDLPPLIPWLLSNNSDDGHLCFYSIFSDKIRTIYCPPSSHRGMCGPSHGYLYTVQFIPGGRRKHFLLNLLTKDEVSIQFRKGFNELTLISMSLNLIGDDDFMAFIDYSRRRIEFYQPHRPKRNYAGGRFCPSRKTQGGDACLKGMHFVHLKTTCKTEVFDIARGHLFVIPPPEMHSSKDKVAFVESDGKILRIVKQWKQYDRESTKPNSYIFNIYQLVIQNKTRRRRYRWVKISGIGNHVLFLDYFWIISGMSIEATESSGLKGNCIYYIERSDDNSGWNNGIYRYDIEDGQSQRIPCPCKEFWTWYVPSFVKLLPSNQELI